MINRWIFHYLYAFCGRRTTFTVSPGTTLWAQTLWILHCSWHSAYLSQAEKISMSTFFKVTVKHCVWIKLTMLRLQGLSSSSRFCQPKCASSMYVYHYTLACEPNFWIADTENVCQHQKSSRWRYKASRIVTKPAPSCHDCRPFTSTVLEQFINIFVFFLISCHSVLLWCSLILVTEFPFIIYSSKKMFLLGWNCEAAYPACRKRRLLGTHQWQYALLVVGLPVCNLYSWLVRNGLPLFS